MKCSRNIQRVNLEAFDDNGSILGKGCFGTCHMMKYRGLLVAVKYFGNHVKAQTALSEASVINKLDHPGNYAI